MGIILDEPQGESRFFHWDRLGEWTSIFAVGRPLVSLILLLLGGGWLLEQFWNRFLVDMFQLRPLRYDEGLGLVLVLSIVKLY